MQRMGLKPFSVYVSMSTKLDANVDAIVDAHDTCKQGFTTLCSSIYLLSFTFLQEIFIHRTAYTCRNQKQKNLQKHQKINRYDGMSVNMFGVPVLPRVGYTWTGYVMDSMPLSNSNKWTF